MVPCGSANVLHPAVDHLPAAAASLLDSLTRSLTHSITSVPHSSLSLHSQVSLIETEKLLAETVQHELDRLKKAGKYHSTFSPQFHFYGYEGRWWVVHNACSGRC